MKEPRSCQSKLWLLKTGPFSDLPLPTPTQLLAAVTCQSPTAFLPTKATTRLNRRQLQRRSVPRAAQTGCQAAALVLPVTPFLAPEEEIHLCAAVPQKCESLLWVRGQGRYSEGDSSVPGSWDAKPSARNLSQSMTAASQGDTQQSWSSDQQHLLDKHSGTCLKTEKK